MKLNLGCGRDIQEGATNIDIIRRPGVDLVLDIDHEPFPFPDNSVEFIFAQEFFEHLSHRDHVWNEINRVLIPGGRIEIRSHYGAANGDPFHISPLTKRSIKHLTNGYIGRFRLVGHSIRFRNLGGFPWWHIRKWLQIEPPSLPFQSGREIIFTLEKERT
jgi:SAM-dependent methyltransferase